MNKTIILLAFLSGCVQTSMINQSMVGEPPANADEAIRIISNEYRLAFDPSVSWYSHGLGVRCDNPSAWYHENAHGCIDGIYYQDTQEIAVSAYWAEQGIHYTAISHEMCHHKSFLETGDTDGKHTGPCFVEGGIVDAMNQKLASMGM